MRCVITRERPPAGPARSPHTIRCSGDLKPHVADLAQALAPYAQSETQAAISVQRTRSIIGLEPHRSPTEPGPARRAIPPSTISGAVGARTAPPGNGRRWPIFAGAGVLVAAAVAIAIVATQGGAAGDGRSPGGLAPAAQPQAVPSPPRAAPPSPPPSPPPAAPPPAAPPSAVATTPNPPAPAAPDAALPARPAAAQAAAPASPATAPAGAAAHPEAPATTGAAETSGAATVARKKKPSKPASPGKSEGSGDGLLGGRLAAERRDRKRAVAQGRASIDVAAFTQCLIRTSATRCDTALFDPACLTRFTGSIPDDAGCYADVDCASPDAVCASSCTDACCVGSCQRKLREGEACTLFASCEPGLRCNGKQCVSGDIGTPCPKGSVNACDFGAFCDPQTLRCTATLAPGAACTSLLQCGGNYSCVGLSINSSDPGHCLRVSEPGDRCDQLCYGNLYCDGGSQTCRPLPVLGQACSLQIPCSGANTICTDGICALRSDVGVPCGGQTCLPGLFCTSELGAATPTCAARGAVDAPCTSPGHCESYLCSGGDKTNPGHCLPWSDSCPPAGPGAIF